MEKQVTNAVKIDGKTYAPGLHQFDEATMKHPHFAFFQKAGYILSPKPNGSDSKASEEMLAQRRAMEEKYAVPRAKPQEDKEAAPAPAKRGKKQQ